MLSLPGSEESVLTEKDMNVFERADATEKLFHKTGIPLESIDARTATGLVFTAVAPFNYPPKINTLFLTRQSPDASRHLGGRLGAHPR